MAEENKKNPYEGAIVVTQDPYAGALLAEEEEKKSPIRQGLYRTIVGAGRDLAAGTLNWLSFSQKFKPTDVGAAIVKARKDGDLSAVEVLNNVVNQQNAAGILAQATPGVPEPKSIVGQVSRDILGFAGGYGALSRGIATTGAKNIPGKIKQGTTVVGIGGAAEQIAFSPYEQRLSNLIQEKIPTQFTEFLQADPDDDEALARFKMALEGAGLAIPVEALFRFAPKLRANKKVEESKPIDIKQEQKIVPDKPEEITPKIKRVSEGPYAGAEISVPPTTGKSLPPSLILGKDPSVARVNRLLFGRIPKNDPKLEEIASILGFDTKNIPVIYKKKKDIPVGAIDPKTGKPLGSVLDDFVERLEEIGYGRDKELGKLEHNDALNILDQNPPLPDELGKFADFEAKKNNIAETLNLLEQYNIDPRGMKDDELQKVLKEINDQDVYIQSIVDSIELQNVAKQQTDNIYQQMMAKEKSLSITQDDLQKIPLRSDVPEMAMDFVEKDFGFSRRPTRVGLDVGDDKYAGNINLNKINEPKEIKNIIKDIARKNDSFIEARRGVVKFGSKGENLEALSRELGLTDSELIKRKAGQAFNAEEAYAARLLFDEALKDAYDLASIAKGADASQADLVKFQNAMARVAAIQEQIAGITAEAGRALRSFREVVGPAATKNPQQRDRLIREFVAIRGGDEAVKDIANKMTMLDDPAQIAKFARDQYKPKFLDYIQEFWINALLSSPSTHLVNTLSNLLVAGLTPIEYFGAAAIGKLRGGDDIVTLGEAGARLLGTLHGTIDGLRAAGRAVVSGETVDPLTKLELRNQESIPGLAGKIVRLPGTALVAEDAFFKSIGYRQELWGQAFRKAQKEKKGYKRAYELMKNPDQISPDAHLDAIDIGRYQTFTNPLGTAVRLFKK